MRIILLLFIGIGDLIFIINLFIPIFDDNGDLKNWATLLIEGGIFLPIAYYFANHFFIKEKRDDREKEQESKIKSKKELDNFVMSLITEILNASAHLIPTNKALKQVLKSGIVVKDDLKSFKIYKEILDGRLNILWELYKSKNILPENIVNSFAIFYSDWQQMNTKYEQEIVKPNPKFQPAMFGTIAFTLCAALPSLFEKFIEIEDSTRQDTFERTIKELRERWDEYHK